MIALKEILKKDNSILAAYIFGSQATGKSNKYSDIDIAVLLDDAIGLGEYTDKQIEIMTKVSDTLNKETDVVVLNRASVFLKYHILKEGKKIYERKNRRDHIFEAKAILQYFDFLPVKNRIENGLLLKIKGV